MCGRSSLTKKESDIEKRFGATFYSEELERYNPIPNFNVAPTHRMPIITSDDIKHLQIYSWGLIPSWAKESKIGYSMINARSESISEKPVFSSLLASHRCIVPMDGFYEWKRDGKDKIPYRIQTEEPIFSVAGLWTTWTDKNSGEIIKSFTILTQASNEFMKEIHDRMPCILTKNTENLWLETGVKTKELLELLVPYPSESMSMYEVSQKVNSVRNNDVSLIEPVDQSNTKEGQLSLFDL